MGTHPIFESDFDCLTEKKTASKKMDIDRDDGGYSDMDVDVIESSSSSSTRQSAKKGQKSDSKETTILHQNYWKDFEDPFKKLVKKYEKKDFLPACSNSINVWIKFIILTLLGKGTN